MDDKRLLEDILANNHDAFNALMERYYGALRVFAARMLRDNSAAKDVVQDVFVNVWENRKKLSCVSSVKAYLYATVRNKCINMNMSADRQKTYANKASVIEDDILTSHYEVETARQLWEAIEKLPPRTAEIIRLSMEGKSQDKIAEEMSITLPTVKSQKAIGIKKLRELIGRLSCWF